MKEPMVCAYCGIRRIRPDDFPVRHYAKCRICYQDDRKIKRRRKGWFKKAKIKFVKKRVYRWEFSRTGYSLLYYRSGRNEWRYHEHGLLYQWLEKIRDLGFVKGFWKARSMASDSEFWGFYFDKKVKE